MSALADNADHGLNAETAACQKWPLERVSGDPEEDDWYDCEFVDDLVGDVAGTIVTAGTKVEVKACAVTYGNRCGRWKFKRGNHERLVDADGEYVLSVHQNGTVLRQALLAATTVDALIDSWWDPGQGYRGVGQEYRQLPWSAVLDDVGGGNA